MSLTVAIAVCVLVGCATPPAPRQSSLFRAEVAGYTWDRSGAAQAVFALAVSGRGPRPLYVEAVLPSPDGGAGDVVKKVVSAGESQVRFEGPTRSGWKSGGTYVFRLAAYADESRTMLVDSLEQRSLCQMPPQDLLRQLKEKEPIQSPQTTPVSAPR